MSFLEDFMAGQPKGPIQPRVTPQMESVWRALTNYAIDENNCSESGGNAALNALHIFENGFALPLTERLPKERLE